MILDPLIPGPTVLRQTIAAHRHQVLIVVNLRLLVNKSRKFHSISYSSCRNHFNSFQMCFRRACCRRGWILFRKNKNNRLTKRSGTRNDSASCVRCWSNLLRTVVCRSRSKLPTKLRRYRYRHKIRRGQEIKVGQSTLLNQYLPLSKVGTAVVTIRNAILRPRLSRQRAKTITDR